MTSSAAYVRPSDDMTRAALDVIALAVDLATEGATSAEGAAKWELTSGAAVIYELAVRLAEHRGRRAPAVLADLAGGLHPL